MSSRLKKKRVKKLIKAIRECEIYDQAHLTRLKGSHKGEEVCCHTPGCIAGHVYFLSEGLEYLSDKQQRIINPTDYLVKARKWLGLSRNESDRLFYGYPLHFIDPACHLLPNANDAIVVLENLIDTGRVDWSVCPTYLDFEQDVYGTRLER